MEGLAVKKVAWCLWLVFTMPSMALCFTASLTMADEVLYCTDTAVVGFKWDETTGKAADGNKFDEHRYTVKVISDTVRFIAFMTGDATGHSLWYKFEDNPLDQFHGDQLVCRDNMGGQTTWVFYRNNYTRAFLAGPPVGPPHLMDQNITVAYGTCTGF
jgi:hypothetical protein